MQLIGAIVGITFVLLALGGGAEGAGRDGRECPLRRGGVT
jgi:hypothetical protein